MTVFIVLLAAIIAWDNKASDIGWVGIAGAVIFTLGLVLEALADMQKFIFSENPGNKGKWIESGVWGWSRHPNYLGEMMVWIGVYIMATGAFATGAQYALGFLSPLYIILLLLFVSGIPLLEKSADKKWGDNAKYKEYKKRVPILIPKVR